MVPLCTLLLIAGFETTVNLIGNAVSALLVHTDQWALLRDDPGLAAGAVTETLRWDPPVQRTVRISFDDTEIAGHRGARRPVRARAPRGRQPRPRGCSAGSGEVRHPSPGRG